MNEGKDRSPLAWALAAILLAVVTFDRVTARWEGHSTSFVLGALIGSVLLSVFVAWLVRRAYLRLIRKQGHTWSAWTLVIAAAVTLVIGVLRGGPDDSASGSTDERCGGSARTAEQLVANMPGKWQPGEPDPETGDELSKGFAPEQLDEVTTLGVLDGGEPAVLLVVIEVTHPPLADGYVSGFSDKLPRPTQDVQFGETRGTLARAQDGGATMIGKSAPCAVAVVLGVSPEITKEIARDVPAAAEPTLEEG
jgi:hypothetical protein